jgi:DNA-binding MarR family transcriptional regulator
MIQVNKSIERKPEGESSAADEQIERILGELEPIVARTREALARVWHDRSVSKANLHVLMLLEQFGALSMSRLAAQIGVSFPNMTGIVDRMEENGLVERVRSDDDRRIVLVRSTTKGAELAAELPELRRAYLRRVIAALPEEDRRTCYDAFRAFRRAADTLAEEPEQNHEHHVPTCAGKPAGSRTGRRREGTDSTAAITSKE